MSQEDPLKSPPFIEKERKRIYKKKEIVLKMKIIKHERECL